MIRAIGAAEIEFQNFQKKLENLKKNFFEKFKIEKKLISNLVYVTSMRVRVVILVFMETQMSILSCDIKKCLADEDLKPKTHAIFAKVLKKHRYRRSLNNRASARLFNS